MAPWKRLQKGLRTVFLRARREAELEAEISFHIESAVARYRARGLTEAEARRRTRLEFGSIDATKETVREAWVFARLVEFLSDARVAVRGCRRRLPYAVTVIVTVALAVGAAATTFNALWSIVLRPLPFATDGSLAVVRYAQRDSVETLGLSPPELVDLRLANHSFSRLAERHNMIFTLLGHGEPRRVRVGVVSPEYFALLGVRPILGRDFVAEDDSSRARPVLLLSNRFWREQLQGGPVVGADFTMNDKVHTVIGVLPPLPPVSEASDVFMPVAACPLRTRPAWAQSRVTRNLIVLSRLRAGVSLRAAEDDLAQTTRQLAHRYPEAYPDRLGLQPRLVPLRDTMIAGARPTLWLLGGAAVAMLLLIGANLLSLTLAQLASREGELAVRTALGASRGRIARQLAVEACLLTLVAGVLGLALTALGQRLLVGYLERFTPLAGEIRFDWANAGLVFSLSILIGVVIGVLPALKETAAVANALSSASPAATASGGATRAREVLIVIQVASSFVLLISAALLLRSVWNLERVPVGFRHMGVVAIDLPPNWTKYATDEQRLAYTERLLHEVRALPGVVSVALADDYPLNTEMPWNRRVAIGRVAPDPTLPGASADFRTVSPDYFATLGVPLLAGRGFGDADRDESHGVVLVNQEFARQLFGRANPLGHSIIFGGGTAVWSIVGVVGDVHQRALGEAIKAETYAPLAMRGGGADKLLVRARDPGALLPSLRAAIRRVDPEQPIAEVRTLAETLSEALEPPRKTAALLTVCAVLALLIAVTGLAGLLAYSLNQRRREFGIRLALGADRGDLARLILARTAKLIGVGVVIGVGGSLLVVQGLSSLLFGFAARDPRLYLAVALLFCTAALAACVPSLLRALSTAPSEAVRGV